MLEILNRYSHGLASIPFLYALRERGGLARLESGPLSAEQLAHELSANRGSLDVALRMLVCLEWIRPSTDGRYEATPELANARVIPGGIMDLCRFPFDAYVRGGATESLEPWLELSERRWNSDHPFLPDFLDGLLIIPLLLALRTQKRLEVIERKRKGDEQAAATLRLRVEPHVRRAVERLFLASGWATRAGRTLHLSRAGRFIVDRIFITAVLASYRPMFVRAEELLFGDAARVFARDAAGHETHVDRTVNVIGSGFQHDKYFAALSDLVVRSFDGDDYTAQPKYIVDMGCGDGTLLRRLYEAVRDRTRRGKVLDTHPVIPVAVDFNEKALAEASRTLAGIEHIAVHGDIGDPAALLETLRARVDGDLHRMLHVRSFLDHDRPYRQPEDRDAAARRTANGGNVYIDREGNPIPSGEMIQSAVEHLRRWSQAVNEHGLVVLEVHCLPPEVTARYRDESENFHFDAYHALSHQYLLDAPTFLACAAEAGLFCSQGRVVGFPKNLPFTRITLSHFERRPYIVRHLNDEFVLETEGRTMASVRCERGETVRVASSYARTASALDDLLQFVQQYWALADAGRVAGIDECRAAVPAVDETPSLARAVASDVRARVAGYPFAAEDDPRAAERELGTFSFRWLLANLQRMGVMRDAGQRYDLDALQERLGIAPKYRRYFGALMRRLHDEGLVELTGGRVETTPLVRGYALTAVDEQVAEFKESFTRRHPSSVGLMNFAAACLGRYDEILTDRVDITEVLFENADTDVFSAVFRGDVVSDYFNRIVADAARETVVRLKATTPKVRILEIGAGTGGATVGVVEALQPLAGSMELCFTDISHSFLRKAKRRFGNYPWIEYRALNIEEDLGPQGFEPQRYDIIIAANVLHDTRDIEHTLAQTRRLLKPGGLLIVNEYTSAKDCLLFSGALLHGYWLFQDPERRLRDSCLLSVPRWKPALDRSGFAMIEAFALPTQSTTAECTQSVMLCEALAIEAAEPLPARITGARKAEIVGTLVEQQALGLLGEERASAYSARRPLMDMGLDSMELVELKSFLEGHLGVKLTPKFLFDHETPEKLAAALSEMISDEQLPSAGQRDPLPVARGPWPVASDRLPVASDPLPVAGDPLPVAGGQVAVEAGQRATGNGQRAAADRDAVAIVGVACRFPGGASSPESFWKLLESGRDGIVSMPAGRWDWPSFVDLGGKHRGIDKAGLLERIDEFDAPFFRISAKEAELMDPQQRLLLELSWEAMEDGGHRPSELSGQKVGVFVGACHSDYRELLTAAIDSAESYLGTGSAHSLLANRVSFFYDFKGPSLTVDTACSSSLVALHDAVTAIRRGDCAQALVGAVNLLCSPSNSVTYYQAGMLSPAGKCRTFDARADGYVRGEGGAMLLLKPLRLALADGDAIYGLVAGTALNHGGQAASLTAPKPEAQAAVIEAAWQAADVALESVGYIEAHGTGTALGDPIEIGGLIEAFQRLYRARGEAWPASPQCGIGSVKTVVGHLEGAAGLAGVVKILLAMRHRSIPATLNFERLNPDIDLTGSPFYVVAQNEAWPARGNHPRRAGVSSFGFGGANSHAVIEEYPRAGNETGAPCAELLVPLSARSDEQLTEQARRLLAFLESAPNLADVAYTLQVGREPMEERVAFVVESREELAAALRAYVAGDRTDPNCYRGQAPKSRAATPRQASEDPSTLASLWVKGAEIDWARLAAAGRPRRTHLPTYPFARQRYWVEARATSRPREGTEARLHPLLHRNTSDLGEQRFSSTFTGEELFLAGHQIGGRRVLPGVAYLEMAREAVARAAGDPEGRSITVRNLVWMRPLAVGEEPLDVHIALMPRDKGEIGFEIYSGTPDSPEEVVHARGVAATGAAAEAPRLDVEALAHRYRQQHHSADACYAAFRGRGMEYGGEHRAVEGLRVEADEVVARLSLPPSASIEAFVLHPGLLDSGVQATIGFDLGAAGVGTSPVLPFELKSAEIYGSCARKMWAVVRRAAPAGGGVERYDIQLCDDEGNVRVRLSGLTMRSSEAGREKPVEVLAEPGKMAAPQELAEPQEPSDDGDDTRRRLQAALTPIVSKLAKVKAEDIRPESEFGAMGFDSISYIELADQLNDDYGVEVDPTVFFEHRTMETFSRYLLQTHGEALAGHFGRPSAPAPRSAPATPPSAPKEPPAEKRQRRRFTSATPEAAAPRPADAAEPVAIVGMSGRFPMARDIDELWGNLLSGRDCIGEIPPDRWDWRAVYGDPGQANKTPIKWGGFIDGVDEFDPLFFNISPHEAELMDPQQRLLMMYVWKAIEDAGYPASRLAGSRTAIFFGTGISDYGRLITRSSAAIGAFMSTGTVASVGPNRMSYYLDLHGPSEPIETACSSSLVAIHRAVWAIRNGHCEMAIAGGVNTILTPDLHISFTKAGMLSEDGRCRTFSADANGYVRSEGVGALLLKKLSAAEEAGDHIYAVIVGSAENHGGRANSLTAPNPQAQAELLEQAYTESGVDPRTVSYIEAHGTGTPLGDPIEIEGLKTAFAKLYGRRGAEPVARQCGLGSVKSNIGHLEVAAGVAGVIKVLLQMQHETLVPSLHCETINPYIHLEGSPFYIVQKRAEWTRRQDENGDELPRRAGVSSFGFGGANAHIVLEEYVEDVPRAASRPAAVSSPSRPAAVLLSARTPERLREQAEQLLSALGTGRFSDGDLAGIAYSLQVGREPMLERLGFLASSLAELRQKLQAFLDGAGSAGLYHRGQARKSEEVLTVLASDEAFQGTIGKWIEQGRIEMLLELWVKGLEPDWSKLYGEARPRRISLPTYPFARERHWIATVSDGHGAAEGAAVLHPLLHSNTSDLSEQRYSSTFTGEEFFLADHQVAMNGQAGQKVLPGVAYLEMVRAAIEHASPARAESTVLELQKAVWAQPIVVTGRTKVSIALSADDDQIEYRIYSGNSDGEIVHCHGRAAFSDQPAPAKLDLEQIEAQMGQGRVEPDSLYAACARMGLAYGSTFRGITAIRRGNGQLLARLRLPAAVAGTAADYVLHPSLMDSALQASVGLIDDSSARLRVPFALESLRVVAPCTAEMAAWVRSSPGSHDAARLDIDLCDERGNVCVQMHGLSLRVVSGSASQERLQQTVGMQPTQTATPAAPAVPVPESPSAAFAQVASDDLAQKTQDLLLREFSGVLKLPIQKIDLQAHFETYGVDSLAAMELTDQLELTFGPLSATLFFEYQTLGELAGYFLQSHAARLAELFPGTAAGRPAAALPPAPATSTPAPVSEPQPAVPVRPGAGRRANRARNAGAGQVEAQVETDAIAIVGLSGRYPEAIDVEAYWRNLRDGRDCITEVPRERWDWREYFSEDRTQGEGYHYSRLGGFIAGVDEFDPLFFNISPKEAKALDPQERLFLQHAWMAVEDAGYTRARLQMPMEGDLPGQVGVYAGVWTTEYQLFGAEASLQGERRAFAISAASIANRVSYALNLHGPSITLDTMCSSSLTALHVACQDLKQGRTSLAIAGGVNVSIHPNKYLMLSGGQFISSDGHCQSFGEGGDGYIPGEGVGVVILKRLSEAQKDGDHIYGVIRGSALNHGGKTNGYTVPNPQAQAAAIGRALAEAHIDARHVSYIEAHGTGTKLGDPIEIAALTKAFQGHTQQTGYCLVGSAKSNIGHCESAAGIAGLTKVLLQMQHQQIVPSLHSEQLNPHIDFGATPFVVNQTLKPWEQPVIDGQQVPRIAGISSFGAGGSNAHVIVEEYQQPVQQPLEFPSLAIVLSARTPEQLRRKAQDLLDFLRARETVDLAAVAYTLQVGREGMDERLGFVVSSAGELVTRLEAWLGGEQGEAYEGQVRRDKGAVSLFGTDAGLQQTVGSWIANWDLAKLVELWAKGLELDWAKLYGATLPPRISLPAYPFAKERYWIDVAAAPVVAQSAAIAVSATGAVLHPLLHRNTSNLTQQSYSTRVAEPLSASACLEMARAAVQDAAGAPREAAMELREVRWAHPLPAAEELHVALQPDGGDGIRFEIYSGGADEEVVHCQGRAAILRDAAGLREPGGELLARLHLPEIAPDYVLHPPLIEDALRAAAGGRVPVAIESLRIVAPCTAEMAVWVRHSSGDRLEIDLCDERGNVCVAMHGVAFSAPATEVAEPRIAEIVSAEIVSTVVHAPVVDKPAAVRVRREIPLAAVERKKRGAIALSMPGAAVSADRSPEKVRLTLSNAVTGAAPAITPVKLYDDGDGVFSIDIAAAGDAIAPLRQALDAVQAEASVKVLLLRGLERASLDYDEAIERKLFEAIVSFPYPTVALLQGHAGGAAFLAAALCDFVVCNEVATYAPVAPSIPALTLFGERFGALLAQDFLYRTTSATGRELRAKGWTCAILAAEQLEPHARALAAELTAKSQEALRLLKQHLTRGLVDRVTALTPVASIEPAATAGCEVIVLSDDLSADALADLQQGIAESEVPVVAALTGNATGHVWLVAQSCDACVYSREGLYSAAGVGREAAGAFAYRLGTEAAREILLTGDGYSGSDLEQRVAGLLAADADRVLAVAEEVAASWDRLPRTALAAWKRHSAAMLAEKTSTPEPVEPEAAEDSSAALQSRVVTVTPHVNGVVVVKMEEREARNMFSDDLIAGLNEAFAHIARTPAYKVVVLTGYDSYFASGGTKESLMSIQAGKLRFTDQKLFQLPLDCRLPVIAAMQGHGLGAGWALGMFADVVLLSEESRYVSPYMSYGFTPGAGATWILADRMGQDLARESLLTAQAQTGRELKARGLRLPVLRRADVLPAALALASRMAQAPRERLIALKRQLTAYMHQPLEETYQRELAMHDRTFVGHADTAEKIRADFYPEVAEVAAAPAPPARTAERAAASGSETLRSVLASIRMLLAAELQMSESDVDENAQFVDLGLDSIAGVAVLRKVNAKYGTAVEATKIYSYPTLALLARYVREQAEQNGTLAVAAAPVVAPSSPRKIAPVPATGAGARKLTSWRRGTAPRLAAVSSASRPQAIAVVGMAGQFPQARNLEEFWQNLAEGKNCITQVPADRWSLQTSYQPGAAVPGKTNCSWVGALDEYDRFDPLFFNISPIEAENMDPQQRLFLQSCWHTIEHAGYDARALSGTKCGVFVGCATSDYQNRSSAHQLSAHAFTGAATSILAARISYLLNLQGPCVAIDTACSSSLVAIAQACDSLNAGGSDVALAGGVYVMAGPSMHIMTAQAGMLSPEGKCFTFDQRAEGFVPGEGVGVVMLKRLADAERDGDVVYGVIEGWGTNQDGKTNGITAPNPESQTRLEQEVYDRYGIDPSSIQLIEAHGTATKLGDPIEVEGLREAFKKYTQKKEYCALGSVKSNIGHCLMAAGVAGVIKILLALQHRKLPPTINFERLNEHIDLTDSPFYVNTRLQEWELRGAPRRQAAVSSFAFNGSNAHLVIGEHRRTVERSGATTDAIIPLSARTAEQLHQKACDLLAFLRGRGDLPVDLNDIAYTLQAGRVPMEERLGFVVSSIEQLAEKLEAYVGGTLAAGDFQRGQVRRGGNESLSILAENEDVRDTIVDKWIAGRKLSKLLDLWVKGLDLDWSRLHGEPKPRRIGLPVYPFAKERYWIDAAAGAETAGSSAAAAMATAVLHPLLHRNTSDLNGQRYTTAFTGNEFFLTDHQVRTNDGAPKKVLPGAAYLEMARAALEQASPDRQGGGVVELRNTAWLKPVIVTEPAEISISLIPSGSGHVDYEIYSVDGERRETTHCRGQAVLGRPSAPGTIDLARLRAGMTRGRLEAAEIYARFEKMGLRYGPAHQGIAAIDLGETETLAELRLPVAVEAGRHEYVLHPGLMDSALQASIGLLIGESRDADKPRVPFLLDSLQVGSSCTAEMFAWVRYADGTSPDAAGKVDIDVCDPQGNVCVRMRGFATRDLGGSSPAHAAVPAAKLPIKKHDSSFDRDFYKQLIADIANNIVTIDDAVRLK
jgi:acyl transferase domain-containing protein/enoyl-CoA hydratase/carnithine racemase/SAM-dependent methyltransferase